MREDNLNDAEIFYKNIKNICTERKIRLGDVEIEAGYTGGYLERAKNKNISVRIPCVRCFARTLKVPMSKLMEGIIE